MPDCHRAIVVAAATTVFSNPFNHVERSDYPNFPIFQSRRRNIWRLCRCQFSTQRATSQKKTCRIHATYSTNYLFHATITTMAAIIDGIFYSSHKRCHSKSPEAKEIKEDNDNNNHVAGQGEWLIFYDTVIACSHWYEIQNNKMETTRIKAEMLWIAWLAFFLHS